MEHVPGKVPQGCGEARGWGQLGASSCPTFLLSTSPPPPPGISTSNVPLSLAWEQAQGLLLREEGPTPLSACKQRGNMQTLSPLTRTQEFTAGPRDVAQVQTTLLIK